MTLLLRSLATATPIGLLFPRGAALPVLDTTAIVPGEVIHCNGDLFGQPPLAGVMEAGASMPEGASGVMYQAINANGPDYLPAVYTDCRCPIPRIAIVPPTRAIIAAISSHCNDS